MTILFYAPFYERSRDTESLMLAFRKKGHRVVFISHFESSPICDFLKSNDISVHVKVIESKNVFVRIFKHVFFLVRFCWKHKVDIVFSHLESANFFSVCAQYFVRSRVVINRHHVDEIHLTNGHNAWSYRFTYRCAREIIAVSERARQFAIDREGVKPSRIVHINLLYDFGLYAPIDFENVKNIKCKYTNKLLLITACRLVKDKRPELSIEVVAKLIEKNIPCHLLILGDGIYKSQLQKIVSDRELSDHISFEGRVSNVLDYLKAANLLLHPSVLDSSSVIVKEAGLASLTPIVCRGIGDFDEYLVHKKNAFLVNSNDFVLETVALIEDHQKKLSDYETIGDVLKKDIFRLFSMEKNLNQYDRYLK